MRYIFAVRYRARHDMSGFLRIWFIGSNGGKILRQYDRVLSGKPRVYRATRGWQAKSLLFTVPEHASGALAYVKVTSAGSIHFKDFAAVRVFEPMFDIEPVDDEYGVSEQVARFRVTTNFDKEALLPALEGPQKPGVQVWSLARLGAGYRPRILASIGQERQSKEVVPSEKGEIELPLPKVTGRVDCHFQLVDDVGKEITAVTRQVVIRRNVMD